LISSKRLNFKDFWSILYLLAEGKIG